ncbi:MAG TPA: HEAT repeat domain-containing protein [Planctomycetota bacterium]|nr:HEAT repeat domain-containing protein [Planctomycetota bacterium]
MLRSRTRIRRAGIAAFLLSFVCAWVASAADPIPQPQPDAKPLPKPAQDEFTYEGKTAAAWIEELKAGNAEKASHALKKLGKDAVPPLLALLKNDPKQSETVLKILSEMKREREAVKAFIELGKHENWEVRRMAVKALSEFVATDVMAEQALKEALKDRDKAVVEAAEDGLKALAARADRRRAAIDRIERALAEDRLEEAERTAIEVMKENPADEGMRNTVEVIRARRQDREKRVEVEKQKFEAAKEEVLRRDERASLLGMLVKNAARCLERNELERAEELILKALAMDPKHEPALTLSGKIKAAKAGMGADPKLKLDKEKKDEF